MLSEVHVGNMLPHAMPRSPNGCSLLISHLAYLPRFFKIKLNKHMHRERERKKRTLKNVLLIKRLNIFCLPRPQHTFSLLIEWGQQSFHSPSNTTAADVVGFSIQNAVFFPFLSLYFALFSWSISPLFNGAHKIQHTYTHKKWWAASG